MTVTYKKGRPPREPRWRAGDRALCINGGPLHGHKGTVENFREGKLTVAFDGGEWATLEPSAFRNVTKRNWEEDRRWAH